MMSRTRLLLFAILLGITLPGFVAGGEFKPIDGITYLHIRGSTSFLSTIQDIAEAFMKEYTDILIVVSGGGTTRGIKSVVDGTAEIGVTSSLLAEESEKLAVERKIKLVPHIVGRGAVVPIVHPSNPLSNLTIDQLQAIFSGQVTNWKAFGWDDLPIQVVSNDFVRGAFETWRRCVMGRNVVVSSQALILEPPGPLRSHIATHREAIGYISFVDVDSTVKALSVNGIQATPETISDMGFPIRRDHALITRQNTSDLAHRFIRYCLDPKKGQQFVIKHGLAPVKPGTETPPPASSTAKPEASQ